MQIQISITQIIPFTTVKSSKTDRIKDFGYESRDIGFSLGSKFEQFENLFFSPEIDLSYEKLDTTSKASANLKKQEGNYADAYFNYGLTYDLRDQRFNQKMAHYFISIKNFQYYQKIMK